MKKWLIWGIIAVLVVAGWFLVRRVQQGALRRAALLEAGSLTMAKVERRDLEVIVSGKGTVQPNLKKAVQPGVSGTVTKILVNEGDTVKAGDPLLVLSNDTVVYQAEQAKLDLALAIQALDNLKGPAGARSKAELDVRQAESNLSSLENKVASLSITAPINGEVWSVAVKAKDSVKLGQVVATIADTSSFKVVAKVKQSDLTKIRVGDPVTVSAGGDIPPCVGNIESIGLEGMAGAKGVEFPVTIRVPEPDPWFRAGMSVTVSYTVSDGTFLSLAGTVSAQDKRDIKAETDGTVSEVLVPEGAKVQAGEVILRMENQSLMISYDEAKAALEAAKQNLASCDSQIAQQELKVQQATLNVNDRTSTANKLVVKSPIDGKILALSVNVGDDVTANQTVAQVAAVKPLYVVIPVDELDISSVAVGQRAWVEVDAFPGERFEGSVKKIAEEGQVKEGITNYPVTVQLESEKLRLGMSATVTIAVAEKTNVLSVPVEAIKWEQGQAYVYQVQDGQLVQKRVKVGIQGDLYAEVASGLEEGERVVVGNVPDSTALGGLRLPNRIPRLQIRGNPASPSPR